MVSYKIKKKKSFFLLFLFGKKQTWQWEKRWLFSIGNGAEIRPLENGRKSPAKTIKYDTCWSGNAIEEKPQHK